MSFLWTAMKLKRSLDSLGETPVSDDGEIKGDDTDSLVTKFKTLPFALAVLAVVGVAGKIVIGLGLGLEPFFLFRMSRNVNII
jgi:hypothetical protein